MTRHVPFSLFHDVNHAYFCLVEGVDSQEESVCGLLGTTYSISPVSVPFQSLESLPFNGDKSTELTDLALAC